MPFACRPPSSPLQFTGKVLMKVMFIPFFQPSFDDEAQEEVTVGKKKKKKAVALPSARTVTSNVSDKLKVSQHPRACSLTLTTSACMEERGSGIC